MNYFDVCQIFINKILCSKTLINASIFASRLDPMALVAVRAIQGLVSGLAYPSTYNLFNKWTSPEERATIMSIVFAGIPVAIIVNYPLSSALCESGIDGGWPLVFYIPGKLQNN